MSPGTIINWGNTNGFVAYLESVYFESKPVTLGEVIVTKNFNPLQDNNGFVVRVPILNYVPMHLKCDHNPF